MPDISMCQEEQCELKNNCYRFLAKPSYYQSYFKPPKIGKKCEFYWKTKK